jgi:hypothetical protein
MFTEFIIKNKKFQNQQGVTLLLAIMLLAAIMAISFSLTTILFIEIRSSSDLLKTEGSLYGATGVGEQALFNLKRQACVGNSPSCYITNFNNNVSLKGSPELVTSNTPIFTDKSVVGENFITTQNRYDFCGTNSYYDPTGLVLGCSFGRVTVNYITTNANTDPLNVYLCEWDPNSAYTGSAPCSENSVPKKTYWLAPCSPNCGTNIQQADGSVQLTPTVNSVSFSLDSAKQQELVIVNPSSSNDVYFSVITYAPDNVTPKGLPFVGKTSINISTQNGSVGRKVQVNVPNPANAPGSGNDFYRTITINPGQVSGGPLSSFPVLVNYTDNSMKSVGNGGNVIDASGKDITFTSDPNGTALLPFELEHYDSVTGNVVAWVNIASLNNGSLFYMFYSKSGATDLSNKNAVWETNFKGVYHSVENVNSSPSSIFDSTSNGLTLITDTTGSSPGSAAGKIGNAVNFSAANQYSGTKALSSVNSNMPTGSRTISAWINLNTLLSYDGGQSSLISLSSQSGYFPETGEYIVVTDSGTLKYNVQAGWTSYFTSASSPISAGTWVFVTATYDNSTMRLYVNGSLAGSLSAPGLGFAPYPFDLGYAQYGYPRYSNWKFDEVRIASVARSAGWITTEYNNQNNPSAFYTVGPETPAP